ncbi:MAG: carboxymuconolactone decarboxylase family protein [Gammaproteobacteria bacterium]|jgi:alkylhydroperoxidase family enzyme|nr:carboxymuconolactone decarboxylase family protein [Gammaproteobacteria bacterium]
MTSSKSREAWVEIPGPASHSEQAGPYDFGFVPAMGRLLAAHPLIGPAFMALYGAVMFAPDGALSRGEREFVAGVAAAAQGCTY